MTGNWRRIERALADVLRANGVTVAGAGDDLHIAAMEERTGTIEARHRLPTVCPLMAQVGEDCGMKLRRVPLAELAQQLEEELR